MNYAKEVNRICEFIKEKVNDANKEGIILGISGGVDSAVVAVLAQKALGSKSVLCMYIPEDEDFHDEDRRHIEKLCEQVGLTYKTRLIGGILNTIDLEHMRLNYAEYKLLSDKLIKGNLKARLRVTLLRMYASLCDCLVIGTTNLSEREIGYFTKYGDGAVDLEPIAHLFKTEIFELAKVLNIPTEIISKPPSAGLWEGQTDEIEIGMTYEELDNTLKFLRGNGRIKASKKLQRKVMDLASKSAHKRQLPPSLERIEDE